MMQVAFAALVIEKRGPILLCWPTFPPVTHVQCCWLVNRARQKQNSCADPDRKLMLECNVFPINFSPVATLLLQIGGKTVFVVGPDDFLKREQNGKKPEVQVLQDSAGGYNVLNRSCAHHRGSTMRPLMQ